MLYDELDVIDTRIDPTTGDPVMLIDEGRIEGVGYVTVLDMDGNPLEYDLTDREACERYPVED